MKILFSARFEKQYEKLPQKVREKFDERLDLFRHDPRDPALNIHKLHGEKKQFISMNVTGDCRALFVRVDKKTVIFSRIGTHSQLY